MTPADLESHNANLIGGDISGGQNGMQTFDQHLLQMYQQRLIGTTEALKHANRPEALATAMRGIKYTGASQAH